ncbi:MAG: hypothetical protein WAN36_12150 [Calditrichia bacterium]
MEKLRVKPVVLAAATLAVALIILLIDWLFGGEKNGTFLLIISFFVAVVQGAIALPAAADASMGKWIQPMKREMFAFYPLILLSAVLFLILGLNMEIYPWIHIHHEWLNTTFFFTRNFLMLVISFVLAHFYVRASLRKSTNTGTWAVLYLFSFVITQSLVAVDWVMSLEFPWISTLFGGIFFMESFYAGIAVLAMVTSHHLHHVSKDAKFYKVLRDSAIFMFGFALAWAGLFYAQYLVIWYGNLPGEVSFYAVRMSRSPYHFIFYLHILMLFIIPFVGLLSKKLKQNYWYVSAMAVVVLLGIFLERVLYILPVVHLSVIGAILQVALVIFLGFLFYVNREQILSRIEKVNRPAKTPRTAVSKSGGTGRKK